MEGMQRLKLYQIDLKLLIEALDVNLFNAIMWEVEQKRNYEQFSFESVANRLNHLMNHSIEGYTPYKIPAINPESVEMYGVYPFRNKDNTFQITGDEAFIILHHNDFKLMNERERKNEGEVRSYNTL